MKLPQLKQVKAYGRKQGLRAKKAIKRFESLARLLKKRDYKKVDEFFFSREELPFSGKEYWFMNFVSNKGDKTQLVLTFGRSELPMSINERVDLNGSVAAVGWLYNGKKKVLWDKAMKLTQEKRGLKTKEFSFTGSYPAYELQIGKNTLLKMKKRRKGAGYEITNTFVRSLGVGLINLYVDVSGVLDGKRFTGSGYVQKVAAITPFIPWRWVRISFQNGAILDFFAPRIPVAEREFMSSATFFDGKKKHALKNTTLKKLAGDRWLLSGDGFAAYLRSYAFKPFVLRGVGEFHYDEYFVECLDFYYKNKEFGKGIGIVEDAYGLLV